MSDSAGPPQDADPASYGRHWSADYDRFEATPPADTAAAVEALSRLAGDRPLLEVAAGTGRVAIELARRGHAVTATDASPEMLARLAEKDAGGLVRVAVDVLPQISGGETYGAIALLANSLWVLTSGAAQRTFLRNARERLQDDGTLVVEMGVADPRRWAEPRTFVRDGVEMTLTTAFEPATQRVRHTFRLPHETREVPLRCVTPSELLLMAELEGLRADALWSSWRGDAFGADSRLLIACLKRA